MIYTPYQGYNLTCGKYKCAYFSLRSRRYDKKLCRDYQNRKTSKFGKRKRVIVNPTRTRPFENLSR